MKQPEDNSDGPGEKDARTRELAHALVRHIQQQQAAGFEGVIGGYAVSVRPAKGQGSPAADVYDE